MVARVQVPAEVKRGETIEIRIAIQHPMLPGGSEMVKGADMSGAAGTPISC